jgi:hypothetical protein
MNKFLTLAFLFILHSAQAQLYIPPGSSFNMGGNNLLFSGPDIINKGTIRGATGRIFCQSDFRDSGILLNETASLIFTGSVNQSALFGNSKLGKLVLNKNAGTLSFLSSIPFVSDSLLLNGGIAILGSNSLTARTAGGGAASSYVRTNGSAGFKMPVPINASVVFSVEIVHHHLSTS